MQQKTRLELELSVACTAVKQQHLPVGPLILQAWVPRVLLPGGACTPVPLVSLPLDTMTLPAGTGKATVELDLQSVIKSIRSGTHSLHLWLSKPK